MWVWSRCNLCVYSSQTISDRFKRRLLNDILYTYFDVRFHQKHERYAEPLRTAILGQLEFTQAPEGYADFVSDFYENDFDKIPYSCSSNNDLEIKEFREYINTCR